MSDTKKAKAIQFTRDSYDKIVKFTNNRFKNITIPRCIDGVATAELERIDGQTTKVKEEDYIIKNDDGIIEVCTPDIFDVFKKIMKDKLTIISGDD